MSTSVLFLAALACTGLDTGDTSSQVTGPTGDTGDVGIALALTESASNHLVAFASVDLDEPGTVHIEFWNDEVDALRTLESVSADEHEIDVVGMRAEAAYTLQAVGTLEDGTVLRSETWGFTTGSLPGDLPEMWVVTGEDADAAITIVGPAEDAGGDSDFPYLVGVDREGEVVWYFEGASISGGPDHAGELLEDGILQILGSDEVIAVSAGGEESWAISTSSAGNTHHDSATLPDGNVVVLTEEDAVYDVPSLGGEVTLTGDVLTELDSSGSKVWSWSTFDHLDTTRFPGKNSQTEDRRTGAYDWTHTNSVVYIADQDALLVSVRNQNQVLLIDRQTDELIWTLGEDGDFDLVGDGEWFNSQHAATMPSPGEILLYDNGNEKSDTESRSARYTIDTETWEAREVWSWYTELSTSKLGDSDDLGDGSVLVCAGGVSSGDNARIAEVSEDGEVVWELNLGDSLLTYRAERVDWIRAVE